MSNRQDLLATLEATRPSTPIDADAMARARARVDSRATLPVTPTKPKRNGARYWGLAAGVAAATAVAVSFAPLGGTAPASAAPPLIPLETAVEDVVVGTAPSGADIADALALAAATSPEPAFSTTVSLAQSLTWKVDVAWRSDGETYDVVTVPVENLFWVNHADNSALDKQVEGTALTADGTAELPDLDARPAQATISEAPIPAREDRGIWDGMTLPTGGLLDAVAAQTRPPHGCDLEPTTGGVACLADQLDGLATTGPVAPEVLAAYWDSIADQDGVYTLGSTTDRLGRPGITLAYQAPEDPGVVVVLIADPSTGALLGKEAIAVGENTIEDGIPNLFWAEAYQPITWVNEVGQLD